jgi:predicted HAD superfamily Cof-like phosphohydrolase
MNPFKDQEKFMKACNQEIDRFNKKQYNMYINLIHEEVGELISAEQHNNQVEQLDALIDILVVTIGAIHSMGADAEGAWKEVMQTNFAKVDHETGTVRKREDGKVLKPVGWKPPELKQYLNKRE